MAKIIKLQKNDEIVEIIKRIKTLKGDEVVFELPKNAVVFKNHHNFSLIKKSAQAMGKTVIIKTDDLNGQAIVAKAGLLLDDGNEEYQEQPVLKTKTKKVKFDDMGAQNMIRPAAAATSISLKPRAAVEKSFIPSIPKALPKINKPKIRFPRISGKFSRIFIISIAVLVLVVFGLAVLLPQANITVYARSEPIVRDFEISVDTTSRTINSNRLSVPGEVINKEISHTKNFPTTGVKLVGTKANGMVQLYNFTKNTLTLKASTTSLVVDGKKYNFVKDVTGLRPTAKIGQGEDQEVDPSSLTPPVQVTAAEVGANYNIASSTRLEVKNSALGAADVYGIVSTAFTGGASNEIKILSQKDIDTATTNMQGDLAGLAEAELAKDNNQTNIKILPTAIKSEVLAKTANKEVNDEADNFDMTIIAKVTGLSFNQDDVKTLVLEKINSVLSDDKYLLDGAKQDLSLSFKAVDIDKGTGVLSVHFETVAAYKVENSNLSKILAGKNAIEIKEILLTKPEIDRVDVKFSPFFVNKAPRFNGRIYLKTVQSE